MELQTIQIRTPIFENIDILCNFSKWSYLLRAQGCQHHNAGYQAHQNSITMIWIYALRQLWIDQML